MLLPSLKYTSSVHKNMTSSAKYGTRKVFLMGILLYGEIILVFLASLLSRSFFIISERDVIQSLRALTNLVNQSILNLGGSYLHYFSPPETSLLCVLPYKTERISEKIRCVLFCCSLKRPLKALTSLIYVVWHSRSIAVKENVHHQ